MTNSKPKVYWATINCNAFSDTKILRPVSIGGGFKILRICADHIFCAPPPLINNDRPLKKVIHSMRKHVRKCIAVNGGPIHFWLAACHFWEDTPTVFSELWHNCNELLNSWNGFLVSQYVADDRTIVVKYIIESTLYKFFLLDNQINMFKPNIS